MNFDTKKFESEIPDFFYPILDELLRFGLRPTLVGGVVRDFILNGNLGLDWDIELYHDNLPFEKGAWKNLGKTLSKFGKTSFLPYEIIRLEINSYHLEFSPPRIESFHETLSGHSNFDAEFYFNLPFEKAVERRDFTINSMGIRFISKEEIIFLDPLDGLSHLREKKLHFSGKDFSKDPVRFLRAHRFALKNHFSFSTELKNVMDLMPLEGLTPSYVWSEMQKSSDPINFISILIQERKNDLKLPLDLSFIKKINEIKTFLTDPTKHEFWMIALEWNGLSSENWTSYFSLSVDVSKRLSRWVKISKELQNYGPENFHGDFDIIKNSQNFEKLFDWYFTTKQLIQKNPKIPLLKIIEKYLPSWNLLFRFELPKDVKHIDPPLRAKYQIWNLCQRL